MKLHRTKLFAAIVGLFLALSLTVSAQGPRQAAAPPPASHPLSVLPSTAGPDPEDPARRRDVSSNSSATGTFGSDATSIAIGQPGLSYRYMKSFGGN